MSYYTILGLNKEPFSTSPDPDFFYKSREHQSALIRLMIEIRLKRGLSLVFGDVGIGKTTLSRKLSQMLREREDVIFHMMLDPTYHTEEIFLDSLIRTFNLTMKTATPNILDFKEAIKDYLFTKGVEENKTVVLLIDEAQKLNLTSLEILRVLLNYETNEHKLLQLILMGQLELLPKVKSIHNLWDRISLNYLLNPLDEFETKEMIDFRLRKAGYRYGPQFFTDEAIKEIYENSQGYPRRIAKLCHNALKELMLSNKTVVEAQMIKDLIYQEVG